MLFVSHDGHRAPDGRNAQKCNVLVEIHVRCFCLIIAYIWFSYGTTQRKSNGTKLVKVSEAELPASEIIIIFKLFFQTSIRSFLCNVQRCLWFLVLAFHIL